MDYQVWEDSRMEMILINLSRMASLVMWHYSLVKVLKDCKAYYILRECLSSIRKGLG